MLGGTVAKHTLLNPVLLASCGRRVDFSLYIAHLIFLGKINLQEEETKQKISNSKNPTA